MEQQLTSEEIVASVRGGLMKFIRLSLDPTKLEQYVRRSLGRRDYNDSIRDGDTPAWEQAFAHVVVLQDVMRIASGYMTNGVPRENRVLRDAHPPKVFLPREVTAPEYREPRSAEYVFDPSWVNGSISAHETDRSLTPAFGREPAVHGIAAFKSVERCGGIPELAWFYCGSAFELGMTSSFDAMLSVLMTGAPMGEGSCGSAPSGPGIHQQLAAGEQRRILAALAQLPHRHQQTLALAYADRKYPRALVAAYGVGVAPVVARAQQAAREREPGQGTLERLVVAVRLDQPGYEGQADGEQESLGARIKRAGALLVRTAHDLYLAAAAPTTPGERPRRPKRKRRPDLVSAGESGRSKRRLVEIAQPVEVERIAARVRAA